jgi:hypothetical protein
MDVHSGSSPGSQTGESAACLPPFELMTLDLLTVAADGPGKKRGLVTGSLETAQAWRPKLTGAANTSRFGAN